MRSRGLPLSLEWLLGLPLSLERLLCLVKASPFSGVAAMPIFGLKWPNIVQISSKYRPKSVLGPKTFSRTEDLKLGPKISN